jgi:hypothetical protein
MASICISSLAAFSRRAAAAALVCAVAYAGLYSATPRFFPDDPLWADDDRAFDAANAGPIEDSNAYDFAVNTIGHPGDLRDVRAMNVNTVDEVPDSSWFTNRIGRQAMSVDEIGRGPDRSAPVIGSGWVVSAGKSGGVQPGFRMTDPNGTTYQIEIDPVSNPEMASGAEMIGTAFYHAIGYNVVDVYIAEVDRAALVIAPDATIRDPLNGKRRELRTYDLDAVFERAARLPNGRYRVLASRFASGRPIGNFRYYGTRPDDPNDVVPHEHRRELRGARVFAAWLNHDDSRGVNSLDMLETADARAWVKHYMFDFGSILGSGTVFEQRHRAGSEYIFEAKPGWLTLATLGLYVRPWMRIDYPDVPPSVGRIEYEQFDPLAWKPEYPNPAFSNMRTDDAFWGARIVSRFSDDAIRAVVGKARFSDPAATEFLVRALIARRNKVVAAWINQVCPAVDATLSSDGAFAFGNAAVEAGAATAPVEYQLQWFAYDNATDTRTALSRGTAASSGSASAPPEVSGQAGFIGVSVSAKHPQHPGWERPVTFFFRAPAQGQPRAWTLVGVERG